MSRRIVGMHAQVDIVRVLAVLGVVAVSATSAGSEQLGDGALHFACSAPAGVDPDRVADICAEFVEILKAQPGIQLIEPSDPGSAAAPGLEISVTRASDNQLEIVPSWISENGQRQTLPSTGFVIMDTSMTKTMRRDLFLQVLANPPA
ncbi:MAG: hypothetical protein ACK47C_04290 [Paracoccaceae bacterium]